MYWDNVDLNWAYGDLLRSITRETQSRDRAYDVLHDALLRMVLSKNGDELRQPHAYLQTVVRSILSDHNRDIRRWMPFPDNDDFTDSKRHPDLLVSKKILDQTLDPALCPPTPEYLAELRERLLHLQRITESLPARCRDVFWLFRVEGYTLSEIAGRLGISLRAVQYHVSRAMLAIMAATSV